MLDTIIVTLFTAGISAIGYMLARYGQSLDNELHELKQKHESLNNDVRKVTEVMMTRTACEHKRAKLKSTLVEKINMQYSIRNIMEKNHTEGDDHGEN